jgi:hypothetical protein
MSLTTTIIRDFAYPPLDPRYRGILPETDLKEHKVVVEDETMVIVSGDCDEDDEDSDIDYSIWKWRWFYNNSNVKKLSNCKLLCVTKCLAN